MLKLRLQSFDYLIRVNSLEKTLMLGKIEGKKEKGAVVDEPLDSITDSMDMSLSKLQKVVLVVKNGLPKQKT